MLPDRDLDDLLAELVSRIDSLTKQVEDLQRLEHAMAHNHGWIDGEWQKDPLRFGYSERIVGSFFNTNLPLGASVVNGSTVPAGEIWVLTNIGIAYVGTSPTWIESSIYDGAAGTLLFRQLAPVSAQLYDRQGWWILKPGDNLRVGVEGATAGNDLYCFINGFRVDIDQ